jgi:hypothetical protein
LGLSLSNPWCVDGSSVVIHELAEHVMVQLSEHEAQTSLAQAEYAVNGLDEARADHGQHEHGERESQRGFDDLHDLPPSQL